MKCLILAAGYATRLYPLTEHFPRLTMRSWKLTSQGRSPTRVDYVHSGGRGISKVGR